MTDSYSQRVDSLANDIRAQSKDLKGNAFLSFVYTADIVDRYLGIEMRKRGGNPARFNILHTLITHNGSMTPTDLSIKVFRSKHSITRVVDTLEKDGLVKREPLGEDRRIRKVRITKKGLDLVTSTMPYRRQIAQTALSCLDKEQTLQLSIILRQLRKHLLRQIEVIE